MNGQKPKFYKRWWFWVLVVIAFWFALTRFISLMAGSSMTPTIRDQDVLFSVPFFTVHRGDIVLIRDPRNTASCCFAKRVVGLPGEKLEIKGGQVFVNDKVLSEPYESQPTNGTTSVTLDGDQFFLLGDNRPYSYDSRSFGPIPRSDIVRKVLFK